jgi:hypothetical protein
MVKKKRYIPGSILHINDLLPWFTEDHSKLPASYLEHTKKFFDELEIRQAARVGPPHNVQGHKEKK